MYPNDTPKLCECGCGQPAAIAKRTRPHLGHIKGQPVRFAFGHAPGRTFKPRNPNPVCECGCGQPVPISKYPSGQSKYIRDHAPGVPRPVNERFWRKVKKGAADECWLWQAGLNNKGYGTFAPRGKPGYAHRFSYELHYGPIPNGQEICHHCDNPRCVNPGHLFLGSHKENMQDASAKGRTNVPGLKGSQHPNAKLTEDNVRVIRQMFAKGETKASLARTFDVSEQAIRFLIGRKSWRHVE